jgi:UDP-N-acetylmuramoyl-tripeptide--D-alanyl-D-alanine ligase
MRAALRTLSVMSRGGSRRTVAVLGAMAELGEQAETAHVDLGAFVADTAVSRLVVVGSAAAGIHAGAVARRNGDWAVQVEDLDEAAELLRGELTPGDLVLVKASRSIGLERLAARILEGAS